MTRLEALAFFAGVELSFVNYYKYQFHYEGQKDNKDVLVTFGGNSSDIYKEEFGPTETFSLYNGEDENSWYYIDHGDYVEFIEEV